MNYLDIRYELEKSMFELISKPLIVLHIICGYLCINKKEEKKLLFFLNLLIEGLSKRKLIIKASI